MPRLASLKRAPQKGALFTFWALLILGSLPLLVEAGQCLPFRADEWVKVSAVSDGDTIRLSDGRKVRFIGINTPEIGHDGEPSDPLGDEARRALQKMLAGQERIALRYDEEREDRHGRLLAHLYLADQSSVQEKMLEQGLAAAVAIAPNLANLDCYLAAEARAKGRGIWRQPRFSPIETDKLSRQARGFYIIQGKVERIGESRKALWLNFANKVAVRIDREDLAYFDSAVDLKQLRGKKIRVRGWLSEWRGELQMRIYHPASLQRIDQ
jgi:endonuclease YncB( thermonuclease family)